MSKFFYRNAWWAPTDREIVKLLADLKIFEQVGAATFDIGFYKAVACRRVVPALPPKDGEMIMEFV